MITSTTNLRIREARKLQRRRQRHTTGRLLIEGVRMVGDALAAGIRPFHVFYARELLTNPAGLELVAQAEQAGIETLACSSAVFAGLTETVTPQGLAAVIPLPHLSVPPVPDLVLILDRVREPGNAGTLLRSAEAAGVDAALLAPETVDPFNDKVLRAGMGAHFRLPVRVCQTWETVIDYVEGRPAAIAPSPADAATSPAGSKGRMHFYLADAGATLSYDTVDWTQPSALIVGGEADGGSEIAAQVATPIAIPMLSATESLNAAIAGAVILFEAARQRRRAKVVR